MIRLVTAAAGVLVGGLLLDRWRRRRLARQLELVGREYALYVRTMHRMPFETLRAMAGMNPASQRSFVEHWSVTNPGGDR